MILYFVITIPILALLAWIIFHQNNKKRSAPLQPLDRSLISLLNANVDYYRDLDAKAKKRFQSHVARFLQYVNIEGVGVEITDLDRVLVASSAVIPVFAFGDWEYPNLTNVILYPDTFDSEYQFEGGKRNIMGMVGTGYMNGQMLLSRSALHKGFSSASGAQNTAIHEFVHLVDKTDGATDGVPEHLMPHAYADPWLKLMHQEMHRIKEGKSDIDPYALTNEAEFFAVAAEYFFGKPGRFEQRHPELYLQLSQIFRQTPAKKRSWFSK
ncbi:zinc-dependent peptidase [Mucilaginibacter calamicampi]|uniref:Zinc-dependent peptidase n=1 Tax=Mucilaginibacter calamicampi TaxID=1302352 RepID=A0ABW2Z359_9SPHI